MDTSTAVQRAMLSEVKNCPTIPAMNASGTNTVTVVSVEPTTAPVMREAASITSAAGLAFRRQCGVQRSFAA